MIFAGLQTLVDPNENEEKLWRMIVGLRRQLEGFGGALSGFPWASGPYGGDPGDPPACGSLLYLGCNGQITADNSCTAFIDWQNKRVGINTCSPAYTLDIYSNECGSNTLALRTGLLSNDIDSYPNFDTNPVTRIRSTRNSADTGGSLDFYTNTTAGTLTQRLIIDPSGLADFKGQIQIRGGSPATGYLLSSTDANGLATWSLPDHGALLVGLTDDDHTQYFLADGTRQAVYVDVSGLTGATAASRYVGATSSGAPVSGTFAIGDYIIDQTGKIYICTAAGTPGTWAEVGGGVTDHGALAGLGDDDHTQYLLADGTRQAVYLDVSGLTGATAGARFVGATSTGAPASGTFAIGDYVIARDGDIFICTTAGSPGTWTQISGGTGVTDHGALTGLGDDDHTQYLLANGTRQATYLDVSGLTGATAASRYVGATASGAPASGTFAVGDYIIEQTGKIYVCTVAGTPGTWTQIGGGGVTDHGALTGLADDDHTQYVLHSILTTRGDIFKRGITTTERLAIGATGTVLKSDGTDPAWGNVAASEVTSPANVTAGSTKISLGGTPTGAALQAFSIDVNQANLDHGSIGGLGDDDHTIYLLASGLREWDEQVSDPSTPASTKWKLYFKSGGLYYIDDLGAVIGPIGAPVTDHGSLGGLGDDDHSIYLLASAAGGRATFATNWTDLTDGGSTTLHSHAGAGAESWHPFML